MIWRYSGQLMGVEPAFQVETEAQVLRMHRIGLKCEPPPHLQALLLAVTVINSAPPRLVGAREPAVRRELAAYIYRVPRALIGDEISEALRYPPIRSCGVLESFRLRNQADRLLRRLIRGMDQRRPGGQFRQMLDVSFHQAGGLD